MSRESTNHGKHQEEQSWDNLRRYWPINSSGACPGWWQVLPVASQFWVEHEAGWGCLTMFRGVLFDLGDMLRCWWCGAMSWPGPVSLTDWWLVMFPGLVLSDWARHGPSHHGKPGRGGGRPHVTSSTEGPPPPARRDCRGCTVGSWERLRGRCRPGENWEPTDGLESADGVSWSTCTGSPPVPTAVVTSLQETGDSNTKPGLRSRDKRLRYNQRPEAVRVSVGRLAGW